jgi:hypothetical protein
VIKTGLTDVLAGEETLVLLAWENAEGVSTEVVALRLDNVRRDNLAAVAVKEGERSAEGRGWNAPEDGLRDDTAPARLSLVHG